MGTIEQKLTYLEDTKTAIGNAITVKGGSVTGKTFRQYATEISNLPSGGSGTPIAVSKDVSDYTGGTTFNFLRQITDVNWPSGIESIDKYAFNGCIGLTSITIPSGVTSIGEDAFYDCKSLTSITIPNSVTSIGYGAFINCISLTSVTIPSGVTSIEGFVFYGCSSLTSVTIPSGVTSIGEYAFCDCSGLTSVTIPSGVTTIGDSAFRDCSSLTSITIEATTPPTLSGNSVFSGTNNCPIYVPAESVDAYKAATNWSELASRIQAIP